MTRTIPLCIALFVALSLAVYGPSLRNAFVSLDDNYLVYENPVITRISGQTVWHAFTHYDPELYAPLTTVSYQVDYAFGELNPSVYHAQNLFWHTANALLIALLLWTLIGNGPVAILLGLIFLVHPMNTEAVSWVSARKDVLSAFFFLSALLAYMKYNEDDSRSMYWLGAGLFLLGLLSKVLVLTLPVVLLLMDWKEGRVINLRRITEKWPYFALSVIFGIVALFGKGNALVVTSVVQKGLMAFVTTWFTLATIIAPSNLSVAYPYTGVISLSSPRILLSVFAVLIVIAFVCWSIRRTRVPAFALAFFVVTLAPAFINFAKSNEIYLGSDRYGYIPMIGVLFLAGSSLTYQLSPHTQIKKGVTALLCIVIVTLAVLASAQAQVWKDSETLFRTVVERYPQSLAAGNNLGMAYLHQGKNDLALAAFNALLEKKEWPVTLVNRGVLRFRQGDIPAAVADFVRARELDPLAYEAYYELGNVAYRQGRLAEAIELYKKAHDISPLYTNAMLNLGAAYLRSGALSEARPIFHELLEINPLFTEAYYNLGVIAEQMQEWDEAVAMYEKALTLNPSDQDAVAGLSRAREHQR